MTTSSPNTDLSPSIDRIVVTASGFQLDDWHNRPKLNLSELADSNAQRRKNGVVVLHGDQQVEDLSPWLADVTAVEIVFDNAGDGRGFSLARHLKELGFKGSIRASGSIHVDQFRQVLQCGCDAVILTREAASRMPEQHWISTASRLGASYQARLGLAN